MSMAIPTIDDVEVTIVGHPCRRSGARSGPTTPDGRSTPARQYLHNIISPASTSTITTAPPRAAVSSDIPAAPPAAAPPAAAAPAAAAPVSPAFSPVTWPGIDIQSIRFTVPRRPRRRASRAS